MEKWLRLLVRTVLYLRHFFPCCLKMVTLPWYLGATLPSSTTRRVPTFLIVSLRCTFALTPAEVGA